MQVSPEEIVRACYRSILMREPDLEGLSFHMHLLSTGVVDLAGILTLFTESQEFLSSRPTNPDPNKLTNDNSQFGEFGILLEQWINRSAQHRFIVDVGARGKDRSNSYDLMRFFGWQALLIEANPALISQIENDFRGLKYQLANVAVSNFEGTAKFHIGVNDDVSSLTAETALLWGDVTKTIEVKVRRLPSLLLEHFVPLDFDLLSIDIEGEDVKVFEDLISTTSYRPRWVIIEASNNYATKSLLDIGLSETVRSVYVISGQTPANLILKYVGSNAQVTNS